MARIRIDTAERITEEVKIGGKANCSLLLGRVIDGGKIRPVRFDSEANFVVLEVGKRGSGKSFGMGSCLESFCTVQDDCSIARHGPNRRAVLLLDPLDIHWTAIYPLRNGVSGHMDEQFQLLSGWPEVKTDAVYVDVFMPAGKREPHDPPVFLDYYLPICDLTPDDFALLLGANLVTDPSGMLIDELFDKVTRLGYIVNGNTVAPRADFGLQDLIACVDDDDVVLHYAPQTRRAVRQRLVSWQRDPLFQRSTGTPIQQLVQPGRLAILCLNRLTEDMRSVLTAVIVRKLMAERRKASQAERRQAFDPMGTAPSGPNLPRTILAIDEAQMILPASGGGHARAAIESFILEGRNFGLSIWMATQRPRGAISERAVSQLDTLIVHRLSTADDLAAVGQLQQSRIPEFKLNDHPVEASELIRALENGMAMISSASGNIGRAFIAEMRPRVVAHGGKAF